MPDTNPTQHPLNEGCFFCATDSEMSRGVRLADEGKPWDGRFLHMDKTESFCPHWTTRRHPMRDLEGESRELVTDWVMAAMFSADADLDAKLTGESQIAMRTPKGRVFTVTIDEDAS
jgi:hypothetical protein